MRYLIIYSLLFPFAYLPAKAEVMPEVSFNLGHASKMIMTTNQAKVNRQEPSGLLETFIEIKDSDRIIFPYVSYATWENHQSARSIQSDIILLGYGIQTNANPQPGDVYLLGKMGAGIILGRNSQRFAGGRQMFQFKGALAYQANEIISVKAGIVHYSNGNILFNKDKRDIGRNFLTLGIGYKF